MSTNPILLVFAMQLSSVLSAPVEPKAGSWKTWVLRSGEEIFVPPPPDSRSTAAEIQWLKTYALERSDVGLRQVRFWDSGPASWRWIEQMLMRYERANTGDAARAIAGWRPLTYLDIAMYDATVACWNAKYRYNRKRPSEVDAAVTTTIPNPATPSYPSEHAVVAGAAAAILAYFYPNESAHFTALSEEAARSRLLAGVDYPSDYFAGLELGRAVAERVLEYAKNDGSATPWTGSVPQGSCLWNGTKSGLCSHPSLEAFCS